MTIVTGLGSWPGVDVVEAVDQTREAFPVSPFLPELPARGLGSDMVGRTLGLIEDLAFEPSVTGWATAAHTSRAQRAARAAARDDLDIAADLFQDHAGPFHVTLAGPWTLAALVGRGSGEVLLADRGACRDLAQAWLETAAAWCRRARGLMPEVRLSLQVDEPLLPAAMGAQVRTASGLARHRAVEPTEVVDAYSGLGRLRADQDLADLVVHCCAPGLDFPVVGQCGFTVVSLDVATLDRPALDGLAGFLDERIPPLAPRSGSGSCSAFGTGGSPGGPSSRGVWLGVLPTDRPGDPLPGVDALLRATLRLLDDLSVDPADGRVTLTPACGLAGFSIAPAVAAGRLLAHVADAVDEATGS